MLTLRSVAFIFLLMITAACAVRPQIPEASARSQPAVQFWAVSVADAALIADWYEKHFGFRTVEQTTLSGGARTRVLQSDFAILELVEVPEAKALSEIAPQMGRRFLVHGVFKVGIFVTDLESTVQRLRESGVTFRGGIINDTNLKVRTILAIDPEGNTVQLFERVP